MKNIDKNRYIDIFNKNNNKSEKKFKNYFKCLLIRISTVSVVFLVVAIVCKNNTYVKEKINNYVFTESISFTKIKKIYNKYLGGVLPLKKEKKVKKVFNEKLKYTNISKYHDGVNLTVDENYLVPNIKEGMVVFVGEKENYGNTIIIEDLDGVDIWYGNIINSSVKLYDYIEKEAYIGEVNNNLYLVFNKDNEFLDYEEYIN